MIVRVPDSALGREPVTGASTKATPWPATRSASLRLALGAMVDMSITRAPSSRPSAAPSSPNSTSSTSGASGTIVIAMPAWSAASAGEAAATAPFSSANRSAFSPVRFHTVRSKPALARLAAIGRPMIPSPRNATRSVRSAMSATSRGLDSEPVAGLERARRLRLQLLAVQQVPTRPAGLAALGAGRRMAAALGDQRVAHLIQGLQPAGHTVPAPVAPLAAGAAADRVLHRPQRELELERLD